MIKLIVNDAINIWLGSYLPGNMLSISTLAAPPRHSAGRWRLAGFGPVISPLKSYFFGQTEVLHSQHALKAPDLLTQGICNIRYKKKKVVERCLG